MRRGLWWALAITVAISVAAQWAERPPRVVAAAVAQRALTGSAPVPGTAVQPGRPPAGPAAGPLPAAWPAVKLELAKRDLFAAERVPAKPVAPPPRPAPVVVAAAPPSPPPPAPQAPALHVRFVGAMTTPDGQRLVYLSRGEQAFVVAKGDKLAEGYVVESLGPDAVVLFYAPLEARVSLPIPAAPRP